MHVIQCKFILRPKICIFLKSITVIFLKWNLSYHPPDNSIVTTYFDKAINFRAYRLEVLISFFAHLNMICSPSFQTWTNKILEIRKNTNTLHVFYLCLTKVTVILCLKIHQPIDTCAFVWNYQ